MVCAIVLICNGNLVTRLESLVRRCGRAGIVTDYLDDQLKLDFEFLMFGRESHCSMLIFPG